MLMWHAKLTWHERPPHGCDEALRPRGAGGAHNADTWQEATRVHAGPRERPSGAPRGKGRLASEGPTG